MPMRLQYVMTFRRGPGGATTVPNLEDRPNTGGEPSVAREVSLTGATTATLSFDWRTTNGVDLSDSVIVEISANGGATWNQLQNFTGLNGANSGTASYDIVGFAASNTQVRLRVASGYGGGGETFRLDYIEIDYQIVLSGTELSVSQSDTPDPVNVVSSLAYSLTVSNAGPDDATGVRRRPFRTRTSTSCVTWWQILVGAPMAVISTTAAIMRPSIAMPYHRRFRPTLASAKSSMKRRRVRATQSATP